jgi:hypothetical protein
VLPLALLLVASCSIGRGGGGASPARTESPGTPLAKASGPLGAQVPMPRDFPADFPIYPGARLTAGASFASSGQVAWGMEWQTLDGVAKVQAFYTKELAQGDWTAKFSSNSSGSFAATYSRKSDSHVGGTLAANSTSGATKILLTLVSSR